MNARLLPVRQRQRCSQMCLSDVMTVLELFHLLGNCNFKQFYLECVCVQLHWVFPKLVSYNRF
jgi:hypothetical protein